MRVVVFVLLMFSAHNAFSDTYSKCVANGMRGVQSDFAAAEIANSCKVLTTPRMCREREIEKLVPKRLEEVRNRADERNRAEREELERKERHLSHGMTLPREEALRLYVLRNRNNLLDSVRVRETLQQECIARCEEANLSKRWFGECRTDYRWWHW